MASITSFHVPECQDSNCKLCLRQLMDVLKSHGYTVAKYPMNGSYSKEFNTRVRNCRYTILHKCFGLWRKLLIKDKGMDASVLKDSKKILCVDFSCERSSEVPKEPEKWQNFEEFFEDFIIQDASNNLKLTEFIDNLRHTIEEENKEINTVCGSEIHLIHDIPPESSPDDCVYQYSLLKNMYANNPFTDTQMFEKLQVIQQEESQRGLEGNGKPLPYPDMFGTVCNQNVQAKNYDEIPFSDTLSDFNQLATFEEMRYLINQMLKNPLSALGQHVKFILLKVLPELSSSNCLLGIMTLATCDNIELQKQAITVLEQSILKGKFSALPADFLMINKIERMLAMLTESICVMRNTLSDQSKTPDLEMILKRTYALHAMLQGELIMICKRAEDYRTLENFKQELNSLSTEDMISRSQATSDSDFYPWDKDTRCNEEECPEQNRSQSNSRARVSPQQHSKAPENYLTSDFISGVVTASLNETACTADLDSHCTNAQVAGSMRTIGQNFRSTKTSTENLNSCPRSRRNTALKNRETAVSRDLYEALEVGSEQTEGGADQTEGGASGEKVGGGVTKDDAGVTVVGASGTEIADSVSEGGASVMVGGADYVEGDASVTKVAAIVTMGGFSMIEGGAGVSGGCASEPEDSATKHCDGVTEDRNGVTESGASVPWYETITYLDSSDNEYDDVFCNSSPTIRKLMFRKCQSVSGMGVDPRAVRQSHYDSDSSLDIDDSDCSDVDGYETQMNQNIPEEDELYETCP